MICLLAAFPFPLLCSFPLSIDQTISGLRDSQEYMSKIDNCAIYPDACRDHLLRHELTLSAVQELVVGA